VIAVSSAEAPVACDGDNPNEGPHYRVTNYFGDLATNAESPQGFIVEVSPLDPVEGRSRMVRPHFHLLRQYQVFAGGEEPSIGKHDVQPFDFHYTDRSTPYGPIDSLSGGVKFFTLRPRADTSRRV